MNKLKKLIALFIAVTIGIIIFIYPRSFNKIYEDVQVYENGNKASSVDIKLEGRVHKGYWVWQRLKFSEELEGSITIGGEEYFLHPYDLYMFPDEDGNYTDNDTFRCSLYKNKQDLLSDKSITLYITHDKSILYITLDNKEFVYPANNDEDYLKVRDRMDSHLKF